MLNATLQHFQTSLNGVFSFSISCFVLDFLKHANYVSLTSSTYELINYIYKTVNISVNNRPNSFKLCISIAILATPLFPLFGCNMDSFRIETSKLRCNIPSCNYSVTLAVTRLSIWAFSYRMGLMLHVPQIICLPVTVIVTLI